jgi:hypothetical protein
LKKALCKVALICVLLPSVSIAQDNATEQKLQKAGYLLSVESSRLKILRTDLSEIRKKNIVLNGLDNPKMFHVTLLIENIFLTETICAYESLLLKTLDNLEENKKIEQYNIHYSRLKESTLNRLYLNYKSAQTNIANIDDKEIIQFADKAKEAMLKVLQEIEGVITILQNQNRSAP